MGARRISRQKKMHKLSLCCLAAACGAASGFAPMHSAVLGKPASMRAVSKSQRAPALALRMVDVPRITLPSAVTDVLKEQDLKDPNDMTTADYNSYSAAAVGGTLAFMLLLGPLAGIFDISGAVGDFVFSALIGGGAHPLWCAVRSGGASPDCAHGDGLKFTSGSCAGLRSTCAHAR